jgi:hypothetical protein
MNKEDKYSEEENSIIVKLEDYAILLDITISEVVKNNPTNFDFKEFFDYVRSVLQMQIKPDILSYSEYLYGAALPMYDDEMKHSDCNNDPELEDVFISPDWISVTEKLGKVDLVYANEKIYDGSSDRFKSYVSGYSNIWAIQIGYMHYWYIKKHREQTGEVSPYIKAFN